MEVIRVVMENFFEPRVGGSKMLYATKVFIINELKNRSNDSNKSFSECFILF